MRFVNAYKTQEFTTDKASTNRMAASVNQVAKNCNDWKKENRKVTKIQLWEGEGMVGSVQTSNELNKNVRSATKNFLTCKTAKGLQRFRERQMKSSDCTYSALNFSEWILNFLITS